MDPYYSLKKSKEECFSLKASSKKSQNGKSIFKTTKRDKEKEVQLHKIQKSFTFFEAENIFQKPRVPITLTDYMPKNFEKSFNALACYHVGGESDMKIQQNETCPHYDAYSACEEEIIFTKDDLLLGPRFHN